MKKARVILYQGKYVISVFTPEFGWTLLIDQKCSPKVFLDKADAEWYIIDSEYLKFEEEE